MAGPAGGGVTGATYVIGSGWWCSDVPERSINPRRGLGGDDSIRAVGFFRIWLDSIRRTTRPAAVVVVDSHSPTKPARSARDEVVWVELPFNAKHATDHLGQWSGWTRSVILSGQYALMSDAEYFVYVEQDCVLVGEGIVEHCIARMTRGLMVGSGAGTPQPLQQSFFILHRRALARFLDNLIALRAPDRELSPEWKFVCASWRPLVIAANLGLLRRPRLSRLAWRLARRFFYDELPVGSGRVRPLPEDAPYFYFQHATAEEIERHAHGPTGDDPPAEAS